MHPTKTIRPAGYARGQGASAAIGATFALGVLATGCAVARRSSSPIWSGDRS
jgi:hypothetical protein